MSQSRQPQGRRASSGQRLVRLFILVVGAVSIGGFLLMDPIVRTRAKQDRLSAARRDGSATIVDIIQPQLDVYGRPQAAQVIIRLNGDLEPTTAVFGLSRMKVGGDAHVVYRVGLSGRIYIDRVEPAESVPR